MSFICLAYHRIETGSEALGDPYSVPPARFRSQMKWLQDAGYEVLSLGQALARPANHNRQGRGIVALSFDDGTVDFKHQAWPVLQAMGFTATLFVVAGRVGGQADWPGGRLAQLLDWEEIKELAEAGVEIGGHGFDHRPLDEMTLDELAQSLARTRELLDHKLSRPPQGLAYPYGRWSAAAEDAVLQAGFTYGATARGGRNSGKTPPAKLRRTLITGRDWGPFGRLRFVMKVRTGYAHFADWRMDLRRVP